jgi:hypothetical protein
LRGDNAATLRKDAVIELAKEMQELLDDIDKLEKVLGERFEQAN